jgi:hypothetical protein
LDDLCFVTDILPRASAPNLLKNPSFTRLLLLLSLLQQ